MDARVNSRAASIEIIVAVMRERATRKYFTHLENL